MRMKRTVALLLCALLTLTLCLTALPKAASAAAASVEIWGKALNGAAPYYVNGTGGAQGTVYSSEPPTWNAYYDAVAGMLTLRNLNVVGCTAAYESGNYGAAIYADGDVNIQLSDGSINRVSTADNAGASMNCGIKIMGNLLFTGSGSFTAVSGSHSKSSKGIYADVGSITVRGTGCTVTGESGSDTTSSKYGVSARRAIIVEGGASLVGIAHSAGGKPLFGVDATIDDIRAESGGSITGTCDTLLSSIGNLCVGVYARAASVRAHGGTIIGTGPTVTGGSTGDTRAMG